MLKKITQIGLAVFFVVIIYLLAANWFTYYSFGAFVLPASDTEYRHVFNYQAATSSTLIYVSLGDSLTAGVGTTDYSQTYPYLIAEKMAGTSTKVIHYNASYPGARTHDILDHLLVNAISQKPDVVTLLIGTNDIHGHVSKKVFRETYEAIISELINKTEAKINVISIPFIGTDSIFLPPYNYYYHYRILSFNKIIKEITIKNKVNYIDLTTPTAAYATKNSSYYAIDKFHPSELGYQYWFQIIYDNLNY